MKLSRWWHTVDSSNTGAPAADTSSTGAPVEAPPDAPWPWPAWRHKVDTRVGVMGDEVVIEISDTAKLYLKSASARYIAAELVRFADVIDAAPAAQHPGTEPAGSEARG